MNRRLVIVPLFVHSFLNPHQIAPEAFEGFYTRFSASQEASIFKLDELGAAPCGPEIPSEQLLAKLGQFIS